MEPFDLVVIEAEQGAAADGAVRRVRASGEIDMSSADALARCLGTLIDDGASGILLDTAGVTFLDSTGLRVLVEASVRLEQAGGSIVIDPISPSVLRVLEMTGLVDRYRAT